MKFSQAPIIVDLSARRVSCLSGRVEDDGKVFVEGYSQYAHKGIEKGSITDPEQLEKAIIAALRSLEAQTQRIIRNIVLVLPSRAIQTQTLTKTISLQTNQVQRSDIEALIQSAVADIPPQYAVLHAVPVGYGIDENVGIRDPRGLFGKTLSSRISVMMTPLNTLKNYLGVFERAYVKVDTCLANPICTGLGVLTPDQQESGTCLVDMGSAETTLSCFHRGSLIHTSSFGFGGFQLTESLSKAYHLSWHQAERLKTLFGTAMTTPLGQEETLPFQVEKGHSAGLPITRNAVAQVLQPPLKKLILSIYQSLDQINPKLRFRFEVCLTGGGMNLTGLADYFSLLGEHPCVRVYPLQVETKSPDMTMGLSQGTLIGALRYLHLHQTLRETPTLNNFFQKIHRMGLWLKQKIV